MAIFFLSVAPLTAIAGEPIIREPGAVYIQNTLNKPVRIPIHADVTAYFDSNLSRYLGTLARGQSLELLAIKGPLFQVRAKAQQGQVVGWIDSRTIPDLDKNFIANLQRTAEHIERTRALIAQNKIAINMTAHEVLESLGKPQKKSSRIDANGEHAAWEFVHYKTEVRYTTGYDYYGRLVNTPIYVKVPDGKITVIFTEGIVSAIEQSEGHFNTGASPQIVVPPIELQ